MTPEPDNQGKSQPVTLEELLLLVKEHEQADMGHLLHRLGVHTLYRDQEGSIFADFKIQSGELPLQAGTVLLWEAEPNYTRYQNRPADIVLSQEDALSFLPAQEVDGFKKAVKGAQSVSYGLSYYGSVRATIIDSSGKEIRSEDFNFRWPQSDGSRNPVLPTIERERKKPEKPKQIPSDEALSLLTDDERVDFLNHTRDASDVKYYRAHDGTVWADFTMDTEVGPQIYSRAISTPVDDLGLQSDLAYFFIEANRRLLSSDDTEER